MNLEDLFPIVFFLAYIGFVFLKRKSRAKNEPGQGAAAPPPPEKKKRGLAALFNSLKEELERAALEAKKEKETGTPENDSPSRETARPWKKFQEGDPGYRPGTARSADSGPDKNRRIPPVPPPIEDLAAYMDERPAPVGSRKAEAPPGGLKKERERVRPERGVKPLPPVLHLPKRKRCRLEIPKLNRAKLREAVVLSEILAKPLGLRE